MSVPFSRPCLADNQAYALLRTHQSTIEQLIVHYDLYSQFSRKNGFDRLHSLIDRSRRTTVLTLCVAPEVLTQRINWRVLRRLRRVFYYSRAYKKKLYLLRRVWKQREKYKQGFSSYLYEEWFDALNECTIENHWLLDSSKNSDAVIARHKKDSAKVYPDAKKMIDA